MKRFIQTHPMLFGVLISLVTVSVLCAMVIWFPGFVDAWGRHNATVRSIWFTVALFGVWIGRLWQWRNRGAFWIAMFVFFVLHVLGVFFYSTYVHPVLMSQWCVLLILESFIIFFGVRLSLRHFARVDSHAWDRHL
jgi:hypothetical protein